MYKSQLFVTLIISGLQGWLSILREVKKVPQFPKSTTIKRPKAIRFIDTIFECFDGISWSWTNFNLNRIHSLSILDFNNFFTIKFFQLWLMLFKLRLILYFTNPNFLVSTNNVLNICNNWKILFYLVWFSSFDLPSVLEVVELCYFEENNFSFIKIFSSLMVP